MADTRIKEMVKTAENNIINLFNDDSAMKKFLEFIQKNNHLTYYAASMIRETKYADTYDGWKQRGYQVHAGERGTAVFQKRKTIKRKFIDEEGKVRDLASATYVERQKLQNGDLKLSSDLSSYYTIEHLFTQEQTTANGVDLEQNVPESNLSFENVKAIVEDSSNDVLDGDDFVVPNTIIECTIAYATYMLCLEDNVPGDKEQLYKQVVQSLEGSKQRLSLSEQKLVLNSALKVVRSEHTKELLNARKEEIKENNRIKADDITNLKGINRDYDKGNRETTYTFECDVRGVHDVLTYITSKENDGSSFSIHTENDDIWGKISSIEAEKLESIVHEESVFFDWEKKIDQAATQAELTELTDELLEWSDISRSTSIRIYDAIDKKTHELESKIKEKESEPESESEKKKKIEDFGKKIGGARKDLWKDRGLMVDDLSTMNIAEKNKYATKNYIFPKPDYQKMVDEGLPVRTAYFIKTIRDALPAKPVFDYFEKDNDELIEKKIKGYVEFISEFKNILLNVKTDADILSFYNNEIKDIYVKNESTYRVVPTEKSHGCITNKLLKACQINRYGLSHLDSQIKKKQFCYSEHDKKVDGFEIAKFDDSCEFETDRGRTVLRKKIAGGSYFFYPEGELADASRWVRDTCYVLYKGHILSNNLTEDQAKEFVEETAEKMFAIKGKEAEKKARKKKFVPEQLQHIERNGPSNGINEYHHADGQLYLDTFGFAGGEFGNWMNDKDRQASLDFGYDAFMDLADALDIDPKDISLGGELSIAFGSRGISGAVAHYEPLRKVINLTKMHGAGSLAHEWGHALDNIFSQKLKGSDVDTWLTDCRGTGSNLLGSVQELVKSFKYKRPSSDDARALAEKYCESYKDTFTSCFKEATDSIDDSLWQKFSNEVNNLIYSSELSRDAAMQVFANINDYLQSNNEKLISVGKVKMLYGKIVEANTAFNDYLLKPPLEKTDFYKNSVVFDSLFSKDSKGYWQSTKEMFARAFACYVKDKLGYRSDYLYGHADAAVTVSGDNVIQAFPVGEEREAINKGFDRMIAQLKDMGLLHEQEHNRIRKKSR